MPKKIFVTGGAGFIGSNLCAFLIGRGYGVTAYDNLLLGRREFLDKLKKNPHFAFVEADLLDRSRLMKEISGHDLVFHMAANSDISHGAEHTDVDLNLGTIATYNVLEVMRMNDIREIVFASTSAVYGDTPRVVPTPEDYGPLFPISFYGASKLACEALISAFCHNYGIRAWIYRFANIIGRNGTHGAAFDFVARLRADPARLKVLGDGAQAKPYLHVDECIEGMWFGYEKAKEDLNLFNLSAEGATAVRKIAELVIGETGLSGARIEFTGGKRGWPGDVTQVRLDGRKMADLGWRPHLTSDDAVGRGVRELVVQYYGRR
ncbi:MAG: NAD-dependent epimerase/dehydratase family protein [Candidatus Aureabacteria bacterium]|nr:NAD-dependent epimerase/dehydratase family protein [Candidatus Auribacterota bacterium]